MIFNYNFKNYNFRLLLYVLALNVIGILVIKEKSKDFFYRRYQGFNTMVIRI